MSADVDVCNEALGAVGVGDEIQDLAAESSKEAKACRRYFAPSRDLVLRDFPWPRLKAVEALALVEEQPNAQWRYSYRMPATAATILRLQVDTSPRLDNSSSQIPFELGRDDDGQLIFSDCSTDDGLAAKYIYTETDLSRWTPDMVEVLVLLLASKIAPRFGPEAVKLGDRALQLYSYRRNIAWAQALNEEKPDRPGDGDFVRAREGEFITPVNPFLTR